MALAAANTLDIHVSVGSALIMCVLAAASAAGASGVAGGSLLLIPLACSLFGIPNDISMQVVGVGFIIGVIRIPVRQALTLLQTFCTQQSQTSATAGSIQSTTQTSRLIRRSRSCNFQITRRQKTYNYIRIQDRQIFCLSFLSLYLSVLPVTRRLHLRLLYAEDAKNTYRRANSSLACH